MIQSRRDCIMGHPGRAGQVSTGFEPQNCSSTSYSYVPGVSPGLLALYEYSYEYETGAILVSYEY